MYIVGEEEANAVAQVIRSGALFRYGIGSECDRFETRYAELSRRASTSRSRRAAATRSPPR